LVQRCSRCRCRFRGSKVRYCGSAEVQVQRGAEVHWCMSTSSIRYKDLGGAEVKRCRGGECRGSEAVERFRGG